MRILQRNSLVVTIDRFNHAHYYGLPWQQEAPTLLAWLQSRMGRNPALGHCIAMTPDDWKQPCNLFTGEQPNSRASSQHVMAAEGLRMLRIIEHETGLESSLCQRCKDSLDARMFDDGHSGICSDGSCSLAYWRLLNTWHGEQPSDMLINGLSYLQQRRDNLGRWVRFPFFYTVLVLSEVMHDIAETEIRYCLAHCRHLSRIQGYEDDVHLQRRHDISQRLVGRYELA